MSDTAAVLTPLVVQILEANVRESQFITNQLLDGYRRDLAERTAELAAIRFEIMALLAGPWMPTSGAILQALHPTPALIAEFMMEADR